MLLTEVILRLRAECPVFNRRVGGTAKFSLASELTVAGILEVPAAFVVPMTRIADSKKDEGRTSTWITERIAVVVAVSNKLNKSDGNGVSASEKLKEVDSQLFDALEAWTPKLLDSAPMKVQVDDILYLPGDKPLYADLVPESDLGHFMYKEDAHLTMNSSLLWHQFEYEVRYQRDKSQGLRDGTPEMTINDLRKIYSSWSPEIGIPHEDDYDLIIDMPVLGEIP